MKQQLFSIIGIDGTGKDHLLKQIISALDPSVYLPLHCTTYHQSAFCADPELSKNLEYLGHQADLNKDHALKGITLFLKMLLFHREWQHLTVNRKAHVVLSTRHPVIDTPVYVRLFVTQLAKNPKGHQEIFQRAMSYLSTEAWRQVLQLVREFQGAWLPNTLPAFIVGTASGDWEQQFKAFIEVFQVPLPKRILFLNPSVSTILNRLKQRQGLIRESHEQEAYLASLKSYQEQAILALQIQNPELKVFTIDEATKDKSEVISSFLTPNAVKST